MNPQPPFPPPQRFPNDFVWGVATSAFQIEGAAAADGKGPSIWDRFCQQPGAIADASNGDVACDHYHRWPADLDLIQNLGVDAYRFRISWPRVQAAGSGAFNEAGLDFYERIVDGLLERGIRPYLTLNHWDLPQALQDEGGWANRDTVHRFVDYACAIDRRLGDRVAAITTHNEPWVMAVLGHETGLFAPGPEEPRHGHAGGAPPAAEPRPGAAGAARARLQQPAGHRAEPLAHPRRHRQRRRPGAARLEDGRAVRWYMDPLFKGELPGRRAGSTWAATRRRCRTATWRPSARRWTFSASTTTPAGWSAPAAAGT